MKVGLLILVVALALGGAGVWASDSKTMTGYLMDTTCAKKHAGEKGFAETHDKDCLQMCAEGGFGVLTGDGKFVKFDGQGNKKVAQLLKDTQRDTGWKISVTGVMKGSMLAVESISLQEP